MTRPDQGLARHQRLTRSADFRSAYDVGRKQVGRCMVLFLLPRPEGSLRLGVVSSRKIGGAVQRNRARRLLREAFRKNRHHLRGQADIVLVARAHVLETALPRIEHELLTLAARAGLIEKQPEPNANLHQS
ncbi:MAG: ribonuclease P protein component [Verrucomicrobia bacterium]|nr:ribonuclease P protein component [Verrucomicrobiota bacterium]